jgi:hypothetical protein
VLVYLQRKRILSKRRLSCISLLRVSHLWAKLGNLVERTVTIAPFTSDKELISFARRYFRDRVGSFRKDIAICLTADRKRQHAYFPALITCIGFADFLSGLHAGDVENHHLDELIKYAGQFMGTNYDPLRLKILYLAFRHKIAHLSTPYVVFDTTTPSRVSKQFIGETPRRITWTVYASKRPIPIELEEYRTTQYLTKSVRPWPMSYNCRVHISVRTFQNDIVKSIDGPNGYLHYLETDLTGRERFAKCMKVLFA